MWKHPQNPNQKMKIEQKQPQPHQAKAQAAQRALDAQAEGMRGQAAKAASDSAAFELARTKLTAALAAAVASKARCQ